jgi:predicted protein tyrosine phosphatase
MLTQKIFELNAPYDNPYQSNRSKILFVCSVGMLRSPTAAFVGVNKGYNTRAVGSDVTCALIPLSVNLIEWADHIVFMTKENYDEALKTFEPVGYSEDIEKKSTIMGIEDDFRAFDPWLIKKVEMWFDEFERKDNE